MFLFIRLPGSCLGPGFGRSSFSWHSWPLTSRLRSPSAWLHPTEPCFPHWWVVSSSGPWCQIRRAVLHYSPCRSVSGEGWDNQGETLDGAPEPQVGLTAGLFPPGRGGRYSQRGCGVGSPCCCNTPSGSPSWRRRPPPTFDPIGLLARMSSLLMNRPTASRRWEESRQSSGALPLWSWLSSPHPWDEASVSSRRIEENRWQKKGGQRVGEDH